MKTNKQLCKCVACGKEPLSKDEIGICRKLLSADTKTFYCLACFADYLSVEEQDILDKIQEFKEEGCKLFS